MHTYVLLIGDGNGAASRGTEGERLYTFHSEGETTEDAINKAKKEIIKLCDEDSFEKYIKDYPEETFASYFYNLDPSGGDPWLVAYLQDGQLVDCYDLDVFKTGADGAYEFDNPDDAQLFGMEPSMEDHRFDDFDVEEFAKEDEEEDLAEFCNTANSTKLDISEALKALKED